MRFCSDMFRAINFDPQSILLCCTPCPATPRLDFHGGPFPVAAYLSYLRLLLEALNREPSCCRGCFKLQEEAEPPHLSPTMRPFRSVLINHHRNYCNCRCAYCPFWAQKPKPPLYSIREPLESLITLKLLDQNSLVSWGGGESTILKEFEVMCLRLQSLGVRQYVHTNALRWSPAISAMVASGLGTINVSLDSGDAPSYAAVKGVDGWKRTVEHLARYREACRNPEDLELKYIINAATNAPDLIIKFFALCRSLDIQHVV